jgi:hypothetical protein
VHQIVDTSVVYCGWPRPTSRKVPLHEARAPARSPHGNG